MGRSAIVVRRALAILLAVALLILCGFMASIKVAIAMIAFVLVVVIPLVVGSFIIFRQYGDRQYLGTALFAGLVGAVVAAFTLIAMLLDSRVSRYSWQYILSVASGFGATMALGCLIVTVLYSPVFRALRQLKKKDR